MKTKYLHTMYIDRLNEISNKETINYSDKAFLEKIKSALDGYLNTINNLLNN